MIAEIDVEDRERMEKSPGNIPILDCRKNEQRPVCPICNDKVVEELFV